MHHFAPLACRPLEAAAIALGEGLGAGGAALGAGALDAACALVGALHGLLAALAGALGAFAGGRDLDLAAFVAGSAAGATSTLVAIAIVWFALRRLRR